MKIKTSEDLLWSLRHVHFRRSSAETNPSRVVRIVELPEESEQVEEIRTVRILSDQELAEKERKENYSLTSRKVIWREEGEPEQQKEKSCGTKRRRILAPQEAKQPTPSFIAPETPPESPKLPDTPPDTPPAWPEVSPVGEEEEDPELLSPYDLLEFVEEEDIVQDNSADKEQQKPRKFKLVEVNLFSDSEEEEETV